MSSYNLSELIELTTDELGDRPALITEQRALTFTELDARANRLAHHLRAQGVGPGDMVGLHLHNGTEYVEAMLAAFKIRAVPVNINYRYAEIELERLYDYTELVAVVFHRGFGAAVGPVAARLPRIRHLLVVEDGGDGEAVPGAVDYEPALAAQPASRDFAGRSGDDLYATCTGGTTGLPKAVLWRHEDLFFGAFNGGDITGRSGPVGAPEEVARRAAAQPSMVQLGLAPLMHVTGHWAVLAFLAGGGTSVLAAPGPLDPRRAWDLVVEHSVNLVALVGDAMARPLIEEFAARPVEAGSVWAIGSGGARLSPSTKLRINELLPSVAVLDGLGSSETGVIGRNLSTSGDLGTGRFPVDASTAVLGEDLKPVAPGSGVVGMLARRGHQPLGYFRDEVKTKATFIEVDGVRWVLSGDRASLETDGTITLHGRGSTSINTGGEKVFPEEVEKVLVDHPAVADVVVVGVPDERWGERVTAVVQLRPGAALSVDEVREHGRGRLAGYKLPKSLLVVPVLVRSPSGKPDYPWARAAAMEGAPT